jgi:endoglucanase
MRDTRLAQFAYLVALIPLASGCTRAGWRVAEAGAVVATAIASMAAQDAEQGPTDDYRSAPPTSAVPCSECVIDDAADTNDQIAVQDGRSGYWYTFVDSVGSTISPPAGHKFIQSRGGAHELPYAARMMGRVSASGNPQQAGMGFNFTNPRAAYDASKYTGVSFYAKAGAGSQTRVRLDVPDVDTDPQGNVCTACLNDFGVVLELTDQWQKFTVPFAQMNQLEGWGSPQKDQIDKAKLYGIEWEVVQPGASYDVWVSDVEFIP